MPQNSAELVELLDLEMIELNLFRGKQPHTAMQRVFGGQVAAQALVAAVRTTLPHLRVHSLHSYFLRPGDPSVPIVYDVDAVRDGRSFSTRRVLARQHGRPIYAMTASFHVAEDGIDHQDPMPEVAAPDESPDPREDAIVNSPQWELDWKVLDLRPASTGYADDDHTRRFWIRIGGQLPADDLVHLAALTYLTDFTLIGAALVPHERKYGAHAFQIASLDHTIWFHRAFRADEWLLFDQSSPSAQGGRGLALGRIFTQSGSLVATVAQEGLTRIRRPSPGR